jgi:hypothetical protein
MEIAAAADLELENLSEGRNIDLLAQISFSDGGSAATLASDDTHESAKLTLRLPIVLES